MNIVEWQLQPLARKSSVSGESFEPGERIVCFLIKSDAGELCRADLRQHELEGFTPEGAVLGRWTREVKEQEDEAKEAARQSIQSSEELFLSLFEEEQSPDHEEDVRALKHVLALMLERKRVVRRAGKVQDGVQPYLHVRSQKTYAVPDIELSAVELMHVHEQLGKVMV
ncbi:MAG TPA: hypothetical protein DIU37_04120 [Opitutae bacterium]|nr:hypothetical protein [Opitutae bacterium]